MYNMYHCCVVVRTSKSAQLSSPPWSTEESPRRHDNGIMIPTYHHMFVGYPRWTLCCSRELVVVNNMALPTSRSLASEVDLKPQRYQVNRLC